jgi:hypothetical protein
MEGNITASGCNKGIDFPSLVAIILSKKPLAALVGFS